MKGIMLEQKTEKTLMKIKGISLESSLKLAREKQIWRNVVIVSTRVGRNLMVNGYMKNLFLYYCPCFIEIRLIVYRNVVCHLIIFFGQLEMCS